MLHPYAHAIERAARLYPTMTAVVDVERGLERTWAALVDDVRRLASGMRALGANQADRIVIRQSNSLAYLELVFATGWLGAVPVPTLGILSAQERGTIDDAIRPRMIIDSLEDHGSLLGSEGISPVDGDPESLSQILFTSGSSGMPKGVMHSYSSTSAAMAGWYTVSQMKQSDVVLVSTPVSHAAGRLMEGALLAGARVVLLSSARADAIVNAVREHDVTHMILVPTVLAEFLDHPEATMESLPSLRFVMYASAPASPNLIIRAQEQLGPIIHTVYGSTEAPLPLTHLNAEEHARAMHQNADLLLSCGREFTTGCQLRIVDTDMRSVPEGEQGQLVISTAGLASGYWEQADVWNARRHDDWFLTGDIGTLRGGYLYLADRSDDMIISGGFNVFPTEVEHHLADHPCVREVAVVGIPDERWGEAVVAIVSLKDSCSEDELLTHCRSTLSRHKVPKSIVFLDELPKSGHAKVSRREAKRIAFGNAPSISGAG